VGNGRTDIGQMNSGRRFTFLARIASTSSNRPRIRSGRSSHKPQHHPL